MKFPPDVGPNGCDAERRRVMRSGPTIACGPTDIEENQRQNQGSHRHPGACSGTTGSGDVVHSTGSRVHDQRIGKTDEKHDRCYAIDNPLGHKNQYRVGEEPS